MNISPVGGVVNLVLCVVGFRRDLTAEFAPTFFREVLGVGAVVPPLTLFSTDFVILLDIVRPHRGKFSHL